MQTPGLHMRYPRFDALGEEIQQTAAGDPAGKRRQEGRNRSWNHDPGNFADPAQMKG